MRAVSAKSSTASVVSAYSNRSPTPSLYTSSHRPSTAASTQSTFNAKTTSLDGVENRSVSSPSITKIKDSSAKNESRRGVKGVVDGKSFINADQYQSLTKKHDSSVYLENHHLALRPYTTPSIFPEIDDKMRRENAKYNHYFKSLHRNQTAPDTLMAEAAFQAKKEVEKYIKKVIKIWVLKNKLYRDCIHL